MSIPKEWESYVTGNRTGGTVKFTLPKPALLYGIRGDGIIPLPCPVILKSEDRTFMLQEGFLPIPIMLAAGVEFEVTRGVILRVDFACI